MTTTLRLALALAAAGMLSACAETRTIPLVDGSPNPAPVPGYRVDCTTGTIGAPFWHSSATCRPSLGPATGPVIRAKG